MIEKNPYRMFSSFLFMRLIFFLFLKFIYIFWTEEI